MAEQTENNLTEVKVQESGPVFKPEREWPLRLLGNLLVLAVIGVMAGTILILKNDLVAKRIAETKNKFYDWAGSQGLILDDVVVTGRQRTTKSEINKAISIHRGDNMLNLDVYEIKRRLETLPWVKEADVRRSFSPNLINIRLVEKEVKAIWQINEKFYPIDGEGKVIEADFRTREPMLLIVGQGAPENLKSLLDAIKDEDDSYLQRIKVANFISGRRWNLILDDIRDGITIKLPEENIIEAWKKLLKLNESKGILKRKLTIIDLRLKDKVVVKLRKSREDVPLKLNHSAERKT